MMNEYVWVGSQQHYVDQVEIKILDRDIVIGHFGGNSSAGQSKNEDGCLLWIMEDCEFAVILDAHDTAQSAELVLSTIEAQKNKIQNLLLLEPYQAFQSINERILSIFQSEEFQKAIQRIQGETACLFVVRKEQFLWWLSIGDCVLFLHHPELARLGEYLQNHRSFYEWVGQNSTFNKGMPTYSSGIKELRQGENHLVLTTDGLIECPDTSFSNAEELFNVFQDVTNQEGIKSLLETIKNKHVRDSTTIISWKVQNKLEAILPSNM